MSHCQAKPIHSHLGHGFEDSVSTEAPLWLHVATCQNKSFTLDGALPVETVSLFRSQLQQVGETAKEGSELL